MVSENLQQMQRAARLHVPHVHAYGDNFWPRPPAGYTEDCGHAMTSVERKQTEWEREREGIEVKKQKIDWGRFWKSGELINDGN